jgi:bis(5'-nucleosyl)-tetraphosphatase (symmetrical)
VRWFVGDVQGCAAELEELLETVRFDPNDDELWCVGDLINRGPDSLRTLELWESVGGRSVIGNHEVYACCVHAGRWPRKKDTLDDLFGSPQVDAWIEKLRALPVMELLPGDGGVDAWVVHAGLHPSWSDLPAVAKRINAPPHDDDWIESDEVSFATRVRCCDAEGNRSRFDRQPEDCPAPYRPWEEFYVGDALVVHGHWAWRGHFRTPRTIGLDSGCVYGGKLTAWCQQEDRVVQIDSRPGRAGA